MRIERQQGLFVAHIPFSKKEEFQKAGWTWDYALKKWTTSKSAVAEVYYDYTVGAAREYFDNSRAVIDDSWAEDTDATFPCPEGLSYRPFQRAGIEFALARRDTLFGDPPGLGKTIQAIGVSNSVPTKRVLGIVPASLKRNWKKEWEKWCVHGLSVGIACMRTRTKTIDNKRKTWSELYWPDTDVVLINYEIVARARKEIDAVDWNILIVDESWYLKTQTARRTQAILGGGRGKKNLQPIRAGRRLFLNGTPITKRIIDLWTTSRAFDPHGLGKNYITFVRRYCAAVTTHFGLDVTGASNLGELRDKMRSSFMIRRNKRSVLKELPDKDHKVIELPSEGLRRLIDSEYAEVSKHLASFEELLTGEKVADDGAISIDDIPELMEAKFGHLTHLPYEERIDKLTVGEKIAFENISEARRELAIAMVPMVKQYVDALLEQGEKVILFCYHKDVAAEYKEYYDGCAFITGSVPVHKRQDEVDKFQEDDECRVFVGNISAAGVGHTLTAAWNVVFAELSWLPSEMEQAEDRPWRIGQENAVLIHLLVVEGSLAARMIESILATQRIINQALDEREEKA